VTVVCCAGSGLWVWRSNSERKKEREKERKKERRKKGVDEEFALFF